MRYTQKQQAPNGDTAFELIMYIGYDDSKKEFAARLLNSFGGGDAPVGTGQQTDNELTLSYKRPSGDIVYHFIWEPDTQTWHVLATNVDKPFIDARMEHSAQ